MGELTTMASSVTVASRPYDFRLPLSSAALLVVDMQRDFIDHGGFGEHLGNDVTPLRKVIAPLAQVLAAWRGAGLHVIHTREGHRPDLADCPPSKRERGQGGLRIGDTGPMGRILVRGEYGHGIVDDLSPIAGEPVIDKPGKGAFFATDLDLVLRNLGVSSIVVTGVTTEVCVTTTVREANDRGYECLVLSDCTGSYFPEYHRQSLEMIAAQGGIFGWVGESTDLLAALAASAGVLAEGTEGGN